MITVLNSVSRCAAHTCKANPDILRRHAQLLGEYIVKHRLAESKGAVPFCYVSVITSRTVTPAKSLLHQGDVVVSFEELPFLKHSCTYSFSKSPVEYLPKDPVE